MRRREFLLALSSGVAAWPLALMAQQPARQPTIGFLGATTPSAYGPFVEAFVKRLNELGWTEGRNVVIEYRWAEGNYDRFAEITAEFVRLNVDVIMTYGTGPAAAAKRVTSSIPIVFGGAGDPIGAGLVASLARPGGNLTGLSLQQTDAAPKRLELLREALPSVSRLAIIANIESRSAELDMLQIQEAGSALGLQILAVPVRGGQAITTAVDELKDRVEALYIVTDVLVFQNREQIVSRATAGRMATMCTYLEYVQAGCFISYGPDIPDLYRRAAVQVDKILRGTKPGDIPVEQPTKFELAINLKTAKALGITVPPALLLRADEVIE